MTRMVVDRANADSIIAQAIFRAQAQKRVARTNYDPELGSSPDEADESIQRMRESLVEYARYTNRLEPAAHHLFWLDLLEGMEARRFPQKKLLILSPPNTAKSTYVSNTFVKWYLGKHPSHNVVFLTSSDTNANLYGGSVRLGLDADPRHESIFSEPACRPDYKRGWSSNGAFLKGTPINSLSPAYRAEGWGASIIGARAHLMIVDDPLSQKDAESAKQQADAWRYHENTVVKRLQQADEVQDASEIGIEIAIMTRWVEDDMAGKIKEQAESTGEWLVYEFKGLAEEDDPLGRIPGQPLWESRFPRSFYDSERQKDESLFQIVYQHNPMAAGGDIFKSREHFRPLPDGFHIGSPSAPSMFDKCTRMIYVDPAFSKKDSACYSVILCFCVDSSFNMYVTNVVRLRGEEKDLEDAMVRAIATHRPQAVAVERSAFRASVVRSIAYNVMKRTMTTVQDIPSTEDKIIRARLPAGRAAQGFVFVDLKAPWANPFINECLGFPRMRYMDQVDAFSGAAQMTQILQGMVALKPTQLVYG